MSEYVDGEVGFVVRSSYELCGWPHDPRWVYRARRHRIDWESLVEAYRDAYRLAKEQPGRYQQMSQAAVARMRDYCSEQSVYEMLQRFLRETFARSSPVTERGSVSDRLLAAAPGPTIRRREFSPGSDCALKSADLDALGDDFEKSE
jgi:hypothetical protein